MTLSKWLDLGWRLKWCFVRNRMQHIHVNKTANTRFVKAHVSEKVYTKYIKILFHGEEEKISGVWR